MKVITAWSTLSSQGTHTYESILLEDGSTSCDCPGWCVKKPGKPRTCRHTNPNKDMPAETMAEQARILQGRPAPEANVAAIRSRSNRTSRPSTVTRPLAAAPSRTATSATVADFLRKRRAIGFDE